MNFNGYDLSVQIMHKENNDSTRNQILLELRDELFDQGMKHGVTLDTLSSHLDTAISAYADALKKDCTHVMVLEDDVSVVPQFSIITQMAISARPNSIISFFGMSRKLENAYQEETNWVEVPTCSWNQCYIVPVDKIEKIIDFSNKYAINNHAYDCILSVWCLLNKEKIYILTPNPLEHVGYEKSMLGHGPKLGRLKRTSGFFARSLDYYTYLDEKPYKLSGLRLKDYSKYVDLTRIKEDFPDARI